MKNIRLVFDNVIKNHIIPNGMSKHMVDEYINYLKNNKDEDYIRETLSELNGYPLPYDTDFMFNTTHDITLLNELDNTENDYLTSDGVNYLYYIGAAGWLREGLKPEGKKITTSYFDNLSDTVKNYVRTKKNFYLFFKNGQEAVDLITLEHFYLNAKNNKIPLNKIILTSDLVGTAYDFIKNQLEKKYKINFNIKYFMYPWPVIQGGEYTNELLEGYIDYNKSDPRGVLTFNIVKDLKTNRKNKFLCFNRRLKPDRVAMISFLLGMGYKNIYLSHDDPNTGDNSFVEHLVKDSDISEIIENGFNIFMKSGKGIIDTDDFETGQPLNIPDKSELYENSYFSIVTESSIFFDKLRFTEKLMKPIINLHPFVVFGSCGTLKLLRYFGFKTFGDFWDESYDEILDDKDRFVALTKVIDNLTKLTNQDWDELTEKIKPILIYNRNLLKQFTFSNKRDLYFQNINKLIENNFTNKYNSIL